MKKLTKQQRLEAYVYCWFHHKMIGNIFLCFVLDSWLWELNIHTETCPETRALFPELLSLEPNNLCGASWFKDGDERLRAIETCIRLCEQSQD